MSNVRCNIKISTTRAAGGYKAWLVDDPNVRASSTGSAYSAARNLAVRFFLGHNHYAQLKREDLERVRVTRHSEDTYLASYEKETATAKAEG